MTASLDASTTGQPELTDAQKAQQLYRRSLLRKSGPMTGKELGDAFGKTDRWGRDQIQASGSAPQRGARRTAGRAPAARRRQAAGTGRATGTTSGATDERNTKPVVVSFRKSGNGDGATASAEAPIPTSAELPTPAPPALPRNSPAEAVTASASTFTGAAAGTSAEAATERRPWVMLLPLAPIGLAAFVAIWGGWVGLGKLTAFGEIELLPGIAHTVVNTAITLPIGVEAYAAYALRIWLAPTPGLSEGGRLFARWSAIGALILGAAGQIAYHLMVAAGVTTAPWPITAFVSCLPVAVLGAAAALTHLVIAGRKRARS